MQGSIEVPRATGGTLRLVYDDVPAPEGESGPPVLLVHGFASRRRTNWISPGWYRAFAEAGRRVVAFDHRGHGESASSHLPEDYDESLMAGDCAAILAACAIAEADVFGYSMGAMVAIRLMQDMPGILRRVVLGGLGENYLRPSPLAEAVPEALLADDPASVADPAARGFRTFADQQGQDRRALAACWRRPRTPVSSIALKSIVTPVLVICGENDTLTGSPQPLADALGQARAAIVPRRDHMTAVGDRATKAEVLAFLG